MESVFENTDMKGILHMISLTCPNCSADLDLPEDKDVAFCMYCGKKILIGERVKVSGTVALDDSNSARRKAENFLALAEKYAREDDKEKYEHYLQRALEEDIGIEDEVESFRAKISRERAEKYFALAQKYGREGDLKKHKEYLRKTLEEDSSFKPKVEKLKESVKSTLKKLFSSLNRNIREANYLDIVKDMRLALNTEPCVNVKIKEFKQEALMFLDGELDTKEFELEGIDSKYGNMRGGGCCVGLFIPFFLLLAFRNDSDLAGSLFIFSAFVAAMLSIAFAVNVTNKKGIEKSRLEYQIKEIKQAINDLK